MSINKPKTAKEFGQEVARALDGLDKNRERLLEFFNKKLFKNEKKVPKGKEIVITFKVRDKACWYKGSDRS